VPRQNWNSERRALLPVLDRLSAIHRLLELTHLLACDDIPDVNHVVFPSSRDQPTAIRGNPPRAVRRCSTATWSRWRGCGSAVLEGSSVTRASQAESPRCALPSCWRASCASSRTP